MNHTFHIPTKTLFGVGRLAELHRQPMPGARALLVISSGKSVRSGGSLQRTENELRQAGVAVTVFDKVSANPTRAAVMAGAAHARGEGCDFVVALGGGSVLDAAKAIALMAVNPGDYWDYIPFGTGRGRPVANGALPIIAIPTTAGTGSETDASGVITNEDTNEKIGFPHPALFPVLAIVDPDLTRSVPPLFTAFQGFDALFHATECFISNKANMLGDIYAEAVIGNVGRFLARAVADGEDMEARVGMALASTLAGALMTISGLVSEHSLEHALSAFHPDLPHGAGLVMLSQAYNAFLVERGVAPDKFVVMARLLGIEDAAHPSDFLLALRNLINACRVQDVKMSDYGITSDEFPVMARNARESMSRLFMNDPVELNDADCVAIYRKSHR